MTTGDSSRRRFIQLSAAAAGTLALSSPRAGRALGASDRIRLGVIGVGGRGSGLMGEIISRGKDENVEVAAVSDLYQRRLSRAAAASGGEAFPDYRKLLERKDIDAVVIATPDHWHAKISIDAMESGKDVYVEKPMTHTIPQAIAVRAAVRRTGRVLQVGPQGASNDSYWKAREAIEAGRIGKVTWAQASYNRNARVCLFNEHQTIDESAGPDKSGDDRVDWDMYLGHEWGLAPKIPWNPEHFFRFRKYWAYSGGVATDLLYHKLAPMLIALAGPEGAFPSRVVAAGGLYIERDGRDIPDVFMMTTEYPNDFTVSLVSALTNDEGLPDRIYGKHGTMDLGGDPWLRKNGDFEAEFKAANNGEVDLRLPLSPRRDQLGNFFDVIRGKEKTLHCGADLGAATMVAIKMGVESYRQKKSISWDAELEEARAS